VGDLYQAGCSGVCLAPTATPPIITTQPQNQTVLQEANVNFTVAATGSAPLFYQWLLNGKNVAGATNSLLPLSDVQLIQAGTYAVIVSNLVGSVVSSNAVLTVLPPNPPTVSIVTPAAGNVFKEGNPITITAGVTNGTGAVTNVQFYSGTTSLGEVAQSPFSIVWTAAPAGTITLRAVAYANDGLMSTSLPVNITVEVTQATPPVITQQPVSVTANQGANVSFTVGATGTAPLAYQWQFDGQNLSGKTISILTLPNIQTNQAGTYAVVVTNVAGSTVSSNATLVVKVPPPVPVITLVSPANQAAYCFGNTIPLQASVSGSVADPTSVSFYAGSTTLLGSAADASYSFQWTGAVLGNYSLTATATFADGSTITSSPVLVSVSAQCAQVAIVRNSANPEIGLLQSNLFEMGLSSQVFNQEGLTFEVLTNYELVMWDNLDGQTNRITDNTVNVLQNVFAYGIPLYLIGENLASDTLALDPAQQAQWTELTSLTAATGTGGDGSVEITNSVSNPILDGTYGNVSSFSAPADFDMTTVTNANASALAQSGSTVVLAAFPSPNIADAGQTRIVTQNFEVGGGTDANSLIQRHTLFLNAVCWLMRCTACSQVGLGLSATITPSQPAVGQPVTYQWVVGNNGECDGTGTILTSQLPPGAQFIGAESEFGTWNYNPTLGEVVFDLGQLPRGAVQVSFTIIAPQAGTFTNTMNISINGVPPNQGQVVTQVMGLSLVRFGQTNYVLELSGASGQSYEIQTSSNLLQWLDWSNVQGPTWTVPVSAPLQTNFPWLFYRATYQ
jgi:uncharacterized repeat protein (TIGR01451 family)